MTSRLFDRWLSRKGGARAKAARRKEIEGDLAAAAAAYLDAELPDEAARVLLLRADGEPSLSKRIALCAAAAGAAQDPALRGRALARKARLAFDVLRSRADVGGGVGGGPRGAELGGAARRARGALASEALAVARELEDAGELEAAAEAYALAGDTEAEVRALSAAGLIDRLEDRLGASADEARSARERELVRKRMADLDRTAERAAALGVAADWLAAHADEQVEGAARAIRARLLRGPIVELLIGAVAVRAALGDEVTLGRGDATVVVASKAVSRRHIAIRRGAGGPVVEDLRTRNGTLLAGARVAGTIPVGRGLELRLGGEVPCTIAPIAPIADEGGPCAGGVAIEVSGERVVAPLGPLRVGRWLVTHEPDPDGGLVVVTTPEGAPRPVMGELELSSRVELCAGDELRPARGAPALLCATSRARRA